MSWWRRFGLLTVALGCSALLASPNEGSAEPQPGSATCPPEMARVQSYCVDRWEASLVDATTGSALSPYYPPNRSAMADVWQTWELDRTQLGPADARQMPLPPLSEWQRTHDFRPRAVSAPGVVPHGYLNYHWAKTACESAGKRLCTEEEWLTACKGSKQTKFPYGSAFVRISCNVYRYYHPAFLLHGNSSLGHRDPRLNLVVERGVDPVLRPTGTTPACVSDWGDEQRLYDMVGNLDEWVADEKGVFVGGFYARATTKGCDAKISGHSPAYYDYSTGTRCCADLPAR